MKLARTIAPVLCALSLCFPSATASAINTQEVPIQATQFTKDSKWNHVSRVFGSYMECATKLAYYELTFRGIGACIPGSHGTWLLTVKWRD